MVRYLRCIALNVIFAPVPSSLSWMGRERTEEVTVEWKSTANVMLQMNVYEFWERDTKIIKYF